MIEPASHITLLSTTGRYRWIFCSGSSLSSKLLACKIRRKCGLGAPFLVQILTFCTKSNQLSSHIRSLPPALHRCRSQGSSGLKAGRNKVERLQNQQNQCKLVMFWNRLEHVWRLKMNFTKSLPAKMQTPIAMLSFATDVSDFTIGICTRFKSISSFSWQIELSKPRVKSSTSPLLLSSRTLLFPKCCNLLHPSQVTANLFIALDSVPQSSTRQPDSRVLFNLFSLFWSSVLL